MNMITHEDVSRFYGLSWKNNPPRIQISLHRDFLPHLRPYRQELIEKIKQEYSFNEFIWDLNGSIGFENAFKFFKNKDEFSIYEAELPKIYTLTEEDCRYCKSSGRDEYRSKCFYCDGKKKEHTFLWEKAYAVSWSLQFIFECFPIEEKTSATKKQLMTVSLYIGKGMHGGSLGGQYSVSFVRWLSQNVGTITEMIEAMKKTYRHMYQRNSFDDIDFQARVENSSGWLNVSCPGNACGLHPSYKGIGPKRGYDFDSHNVDSPIQQLTLLAGLAALHDLADKEI